MVYNNFQNHFTQKLLALAAHCVGNSLYNTTALNFTINPSLLLLSEEVQIWLYGLPQNDPNSFGEFNPPLQAPQLLVRQPKIH